MYFVITHVLRTMVVIINHKKISLTIYNKYTAKKYETISRTRMNKQRQLSNI